MSTRPSDSAAQPGLPAEVSASWAADDSSAWPGLATATRRAAPGEWRTDRLVVAHLEIADVDRHPDPIVDHRPCCPHGLDRLGEHDVAGRALRGQT